MTASSCLALFFMAITRRAGGVSPSCFKYKKVPPRLMQEKSSLLSIGPVPRRTGSDFLFSRKCGSCHLANSHTSTCSERKRIRFSARAPNNLRLANFGGLTAGEPPAKRRTKRVLSFRALFPFPSSKSWGHDQIFLIIEIKWSDWVVHFCFITQPLIFNCTTIWSCSHYLYVAAQKY